MKVKPLFDKVVVESVETEERTQSGFILPSAAQEKQQMAKIVAVGPGGIIDGKEVKMQVKVAQGYQPRLDDNDLNELFTVAGLPLLEPGELEQEVELINIKKEETE